MPFSGRAIMLLKSFLMPSHEKAFFADAAFLKAPGEGVERIGEKQCFPSGKAYPRA